MNQDLKYSDYIKHYQKDAEYSDYFLNNKFNEQVIKRRYEEFWYYYNLSTDDIILEIGSGGGEALKSIDTGTIHYVPLDLSLKNLKILHKKSNKTSCPVTGDAFYLPFSNESFDLVILSEVLEHLHEPGTVLKEVNRVLKNMGSILVSVPYNEKLSYHLCIHCNKPTPLNAHIHSFNDESLTDLLNKHGFQVRKVRKGCNKITNRLHLNILAKNLPFKLWLVFDRLANFIIPKPTYITVKASK
jgi:ubiquinone/menaquinone biosynthesis C-methylase UbiE